MSVRTAQSYHTNQVHYLRADLPYDGAPGPLLVGAIPPGAVVTAAVATVATAFNSGTTDTITLGFREAAERADAADGLAAGIDGQAQGQQVGDLGASGNLYFPEGAEITATHTPDGAAATAGLAIVHVEYIVPNGA